LFHENLFEFLAGKTQAAQHGRRDLGRMGDVLEGPAIPNAKGSQGFGRIIESAHSFEFTPALSAWHSPLVDFR